MRRIAQVLVTFALFLSAKPSSAFAAKPVDFDTQIVPLLTKSGCNAGACHGAAIGRGGFKLSLYGGNPQADHSAIVHQLEGRRINLAKPGRSLLLLKPTNYMPHGGNERFAMESESAELMKRWIADGANRIGKRSLVKLVVSPRAKILVSTGSSARLKLVAEFNDGSKSDVTAWTVFTPEDDAAVGIEKGSATVKRRGEHIVIARYLDRVVPIRLLVPLASKPVDLSKQQRANFIDQFVLKKLETLRLPVASPTNDSAFLRRVTLDLTGRLPTYEEAKGFIADSGKDKRARLIDRLLKSEAFNDYWTFRFAELLRIRSQPRDTTGAKTYHAWLRKQIAAGTSMDKIAKSLLTATGDSHSYGPANFYRTAAGARLRAEFVSELFMGVRLRCANCHNHPLDRWTQDDYHGFAAIFAKVRTGRVISVSTRGDVTHPRTGEPAVPRIPGVRFLKSSNRDSKRSAVDGRVEFAKWLTSHGNPFFAKAIVNRLWQAMMGRGLVEPADDLRATNPATHPELLNRLAADFEKNGYNIRHTLKQIASSAAYARSSSFSRDQTGSATDARYYSRAVPRKLSPHLLVDAVSRVTGVAEKFGSQPLGTPAVKLFDAKIASTTLDILGRCDRSGSCESGGTAGGGLTAKLHWINGPFLNRKVESPNGRLHQLIKTGKSDAVIVEEFYVRALSRQPNERERAFWKKQLGVAKTPRSRKQLLEDFVWSLLSSREFQTR